MSGILSGCAVTVSNPPDMNIHVAPGDAMFAGTEHTVTGSTTAIAAADSTNPRIDLVCVHSTGTTVIAQGTPAISPVAPTPSGTDIVVAYVWVPAATPSINDHLISDRRQFVGGVSSVDGRSGAVALTPVDVGLTVGSGPTHLTDNTGGTPAATLVVVRSDTAAHTAADAIANFASLNAQVNALQTQLVAAGIIT